MGLDNIRDSELAPDLPNVPIESSQVKGLRNRFTAILTLAAALSSCDAGGQDVYQTEVEGRGPLFGSVAFTTDTVHKNLIFLGNTPDGESADVIVTVEHSGGQFKESYNVQGSYSQAIPLKDFDSIKSVILEDDIGNQVIVPSQHYSYMDDDFGFVPNRHE